MAFALREPNPATVVSPAMSTPRPVTSTAEAHHLIPRPALKAHNAEIMNKMYSVGGADRHQQHRQNRADDGDRQIDETHEPQAPQRGKQHRAQGVNHTGHAVKADEEEHRHDRNHNGQQARDVRGQGLGYRMVHHRLSRLVHRIGGAAEILGQANP